jgi:bacterioferritin-associated ferredoxin
MHIDRCICTGRTFADLREQAQREGLDLDGVMALAGEKGTRCGLCRPYLRRTLTTGRCVFDRIMIEPTLPDGE